MTSASQAFPWFQALLRASDELALLVVHLYRSLAVLVGNDREQLRHWFHTANCHTGGVPAEQVQRTEDLVAIVHYLDALRTRPAVWLPHAPRFAGGGGV